MPEPVETPEVYIGIQVIARIHPGDRDAITDQIERMLCPFGHFPEAGDPPQDHVEDCRMEMMGSTTHGDLAKVLTWMMPEEVSA